MRTDKCKICNKYTKYGGVLTGNAGYICMKCYIKKHILKHGGKVK